MNWVPIAISLGAILGALSRYYVTLFWIHKKGPQFPYGTLFANLTGALLIGVLSAFSQTRGLPVAIEKFAFVGFLGAYTTFSSYILDTANLFRTRKTVSMLFYWLGSPVLGLIVVKLGLFLGQAIG
jgi:CrcB protein